MRRAGLMAAMIGLVLACGPACAQDAAFARLWGDYPVGNPYPDPGGKFGDNQCAIRLSVALWRAGADLHAFGGAAVRVDGRKVAIRADELAAWLQARRPSWVGPAEVVTGEHWRAKIAGRTGIVFFHDYMPAGAGKRGFTGNHIDLWHGWRLSLATGGNDWEVACGAVGVMPEGVGWCYDKGKAKEILFWPVR